MNIAIVASHPIQYQAPWFRELAARVNLTVFFCHRQNAAGQAAAGYGDGFEWDRPLLDGYRHEWLVNVAREPSVFRFGGCDTPGIDARIRDGGFDACIVSGWYLKSYVQAVLACRRHGVPVLLRGDSHLGTARSAVKKAVKYVPYRLMLNSVAGHLYVGEANRQYLAHYGVPPDRLFFVPHVVDDPWFSKQAAEARQSGAAAAVRRDLDVPDDASLVLFVGRIVDQKRPLDFVDGVSRASRITNIVGVMVGSGPLEKAVDVRRRETDAPVRLAGFRNQTSLPALYAAAQMIVLPSDGRETWGMVVSEAMACGIPAIVSDAVGCGPDLIQPDTGRIYPLGDVDALVDAIVTLDDLQRSNPDAVRTALRDVMTRFGAASAADRTVAAVACVASSSQATLV